MVALMLNIGCTATPEPVPPQPCPPGDPKCVPGPEVDPATVTKKTVEQAFEHANALFLSHDRGNDWSASSCKPGDKGCDASRNHCDVVVAAFERAQRLNRKLSKRSLPHARYNQAIAQTRCGRRASARAIFAELLDADSGFHRARLQLALHDLAEGKITLEKALAEVDRAVVDSHFDNVEALVTLAMLQMQRHNQIADADGNNDMDRAKKNLQRALAINDAFMPAHNQLAIYYLESARAAGAKRQAKLAALGNKKVKRDNATLELAALVCAQAIKKDPSYAPVYNTHGLIRAELGDLGGAARSFGKARTLSPGFFEAHMNYAAVNLQFHGFGNAQMAYQHAIAIRPKSYEARLGLALALRGQIRPNNSKAMIAASHRELERAKRIDANRPEAYFNEAILTQEFKAREVADSKPVLTKARVLYGTFIAKAKGQPRLASAVARARERISDIDRMLSFLQGNKPVVNNRPTP